MAGETRTLLCCRTAGISLKVLIELATAYAEGVSWGGFDKSVTSVRSHSPGMAPVVAITG